MINRVRYDETTQVLQVEFSNGSVYEYDSVDPDDAAGLETASSVGSYFHDVIKPYGGHQV